ncbi:hypothetical protein [Vallitalea guaymasensis]|uniref:Uncharacterized protein n=1 Tax=Vallitalea guaymasensis TaxID=1185412 RepID=A0A8J8MA08_9FIRM|nr:hypothetical protein [Vallitalea guaymasensis]QUH29099.1 hypothetical protein HYG85_09255 [Vallitalea guaymasensis]
MDNQLIIEKNIKDFMKEKPYSIKMIKDEWFLIIFFGLLPAVFGIYNYITFPLFAITIVYMIVWGHKIIKNNIIQQFILYIGTSLLIVSIECLLGVFKVFSINRVMTLMEIFLILIIYITFITIYSISYIRKVNQGNPKKNKSGLTFIFVAPLMGILVGRSLKDNISNDQAILLLGLISLILSILMGVGIKYIINDYYIKKYQIEMITEDSELS